MSLNLGSIVFEDQLITPSLSESIPGPPPLEDSIPGPPPFEESIPGPPPDDDETPGPPSDENEIPGPPPLEESVPEPPPEELEDITPTPPVEQKVATEQKQKRDDKYYIDLAQTRFEDFKGKLRTILRNRHGKNEFNVNVSRESVNGPYSVMSVELFYRDQPIHEYANVETIGHWDKEYKLLKINELKVGDKIFSVTKYGNVIKTQKTTPSGPKSFAEASLQTSSPSKIREFVAGFKPSTNFEQLAKEYFDAEQQKFANDLLKQKDELPLTHAVDVKLEKVQNEIKNSIDQLDKNTPKKIADEVEKVVSSLVIDGDLQKVKNVKADVKTLGEVKVAIKEIAQENKMPFSISDYERLTELGKGAYGTVFSVKNKKTGETLVIKQLNKGMGIGEKAIRREIAMLNNLKPSCGQHILCYDGSFEDEKHYYILTEFLGDYIPLDKLPTDTRSREPFRLAQIFQNLIQGLSKIHAQGIAHRDIKLANILVEAKGSRIKYIDFGFACDEKECVGVGVAGTLAYISPELCLRGLGGKYVEKPFGLESSKKADIFALGATIYSLITTRARIDIWFTDYLSDPSKAAKYSTFPLAVVDKMRLLEYFQSYIFPEITNKLLQKLDAQTENNMGLDGKLLGLKFTLNDFLNKDPEKRKLPIII